jgi:hypothetical protein
MLYIFFALATTGEDYTIVMEPSVILSTEFPNATITIEIVDDDHPEPDESFQISLFFMQQIPRVTLDPRTINITIQGMKLN